MTGWRAALAALVDNPLPEVASPAVAGLIGDHPSAYARSPRMWIAALAALGIPATYLPLDVGADGLPALLRWIRETPACLGVNVTTPHKAAVIPHLDHIDAGASAIGAVNTIARRADGSLAGTNTDAAGLLAALRHRDGQGRLVGRLDGLTVLLLGAGGAGRAAAVALAPRLGRGALLIVNRHHDAAVDLAARVRALGGHAEAVPHDELDGRLSSVRLVINASLCGQAGILKRPEGWTCLEPYSALAPAHPVVLPPMREDEFRAAWASRAASDVQANHELSRARVRRLPEGAVVYDMIYAPPETVLLQHARAAGLRGANGRWMNIAQAVEAFIRHICAPALASRGIDARAARRRVQRVMARAWDG
jgi:shikimate dehydrogenase